MNKVSGVNVHISDAVATLPPVSEMMRDAGLFAKKQLGQNFLFDLNLTGRIARAVPDITRIPVVEVGPGPGGLTRALLNAGAPRVVAIEKDPGTEPILTRIQDAASGRLCVIYDDAMRVDMNAIGLSDYAICSNLPYNVGTGLLIGWLHKIATQHDGHGIQSLTLMFQKEVAQRITARAGDEHYGRLGVLTAMVADARILFDVPRSAFTPAPKVTSAVVQIIPNGEKIARLDNLAAIEKITAKLFGQRRKMIRAIIPGVDWAQFGLNGTERAENLGAEKFAELAAANLL